MTRVQQSKNPLPGFLLVDSGARRAVEGFRVADSSCVDVDGIGPRALFETNVEIETG